MAKTMDGVPGQLLHSKFVDFAQVGGGQCPRDVSLDTLFRLPLIVADQRNSSIMCELAASSKRYIAL